MSARIVFIEHGLGIFFDSPIEPSKATEKNLTILAEPCLAL